MVSQEVVMGHKQDDQGKSAIDGVKAVGGFYMVLKGSVESFDELLVGSELLRLTVEILEADYFAVLEGRILSSLGIEEVDASGIGRVSIGHQDKGLVWISGADGFFHCNNSWESLPGCG